MFILSMADDGLSGYISFNREGGIGKDDIYRWVRTTQDPLVLDWYTKPLCITDFYSQEQIEGAQVMLLEFVDALRYTDVNTDNIEIIKQLSVENQQDILAVSEAR